MFEEPFRFVEAIANRREYIEGQIASGSPLVALNYQGGILLFTLGRERQKLFEVYDRIAMGAIGHPGDIERLRMTAIELASTEGFTRSSGDVSLRRMANYSLSPALKAAFEQVYGPPYLARMLFVELGLEPAQNLFLRVDYDGAIQTNGSPLSRMRQEYAVLSGARLPAEQMEKFLSTNYRSGLSLDEALRLALDVWTVGYLLTDEENAPDNLPTEEALRTAQREQLANAAIEAAVLEYAAKSAVTYRMLTAEETRSLLPENG
jgi:proteasome alpha subunit